jgi:hypothetical protein
MSEPQSREPSKPSVSHDFFDYRSVVGFDSSYMAQYYSDRNVNSDERALIEYFVPRLKAFTRFAGPHASFLEIGCGPTLLHAILVTPYVKEMYLTDFLEGNRTAVEQWQLNPKAVDWHHYTRFILETEQRDAGDQQIQERENCARQKIVRVIPCNLMSPVVVDTGDLYDLAGCFYCLAEVARTPESFRTMIANVASLIRPGGTLMIAALRSTSFYHVRGNNGEEVEFPCLAVTESLVERALSDAGFEIRPGDVVSVDVEGQADEGVPGIILAFVEKRNPA